MTDVNLTWENPPSSLGIKELKIFKIAEDYTEKNYAVFIEDSELLASVPMTAPNVAQTYVDEDVDPGTYTYGIFSSNNLGLGPGDLIDTAVVVIPPLQIDITPGYVSYASLSWSISYTGELSEYNTFTYEISTSDVDFDNNIVSSEQGSTALVDKLWVSLAPQTDYYFRVKAQGLFSAVSNISGHHTDPCTQFSATRTDDLDGTYTLTINTNEPEEGVWVSEGMNGVDIRGLVRPIADDQYGNPFIAVVEGNPYSPIDKTMGGRAVFDAGMLKYEDLKWSSSYKTNVYASNVPAQFPFLVNAIKYTKRVFNPTAKALYLNDRSSLHPTVPNKYNVRHFDTCLNDLLDIAGLQMDFWKGLDADSSHYQWFIDDAGNESAESFLDYLNQYDIFVFVSADQQEVRYLPDNIVRAIHDFVDAGGGMIVLTDHNVFQWNANAIVAKYGFQFTGNVDRIAGNEAYRVSTMLANSTYLPGGFHPLFENINKNSFVSAGLTEGLIKLYDSTDGFDSTEDPLPHARTSAYISGSDQSLEVTSHTDTSSTPIGKGKIIVRTSNGCGAIFPQIL